VGGNFWIIEFVERVAALPQSARAHANHLCEYEEIRQRRKKEERKHLLSVDDDDMTLTMIGIL
jgi:hypothetical protein